MERERELIGEGSSSSLKEQRNLKEKQRRMHMKDLYIKLSSYVSPTRRLPAPQLIDKATSFMIQLREKVDYLKEKKRKLLSGEVGNCSLLPILNIHSRDSTIQMNLVVPQNKKSVMLHKLVSVFEEEGAHVMSVNHHNSNDKTTYTIIAQAFISRIGIDPSRIEERVRDIIFS